jgi:imidazoleglycerol phosphate dehydratase HisB
MKSRTAKIKRETKETKVSLELGVDGAGQAKISTGIKMFDHLLSQLAQHGRFDLVVSAGGDDEHHVIEDVAICLGKALAEALGEKRGKILYGTNDHHKAEALFKALGRAMDMATRIDQRISGELPSTKGRLEG